VSRLQVVYLVIRADGDVRVAKRPRLALDETAVEVNIAFPDGWGEVTGRLDIQMPEPPTAEQPEPADA
jgi:hypothetical protein